MPDNATLDQLREALAENPSNVELRLIYADCLEEMGDAEAARRHRRIAELPHALRSLVVRTELLVERTFRPILLALTVAAALTLLHPSMQGPRLERGEFQAE